MDRTALARIAAARHDIATNPAARPARPGEINHAAIDGFTIGHAMVGVGLALLGIPWWGALAVAIGWELVERPLKTTMPEVFPHASQDTFTNAFFDAAGMMTGWAITRGIRVGHFRGF
jgi:hypothetical protein